MQHDVQELSRVVSHRMAVLLDVGEGHGCNSVVRFNLNLQLGCDNFSSCVM